MKDDSLLEAAFIAGFRAAADKHAFLRLAGIPTALARADAPDLNLIEVKIEEVARVGAAAPGFATRALSYHPLPGALISQTTRLAFAYVAADGVEDRTLQQLRVQPAPMHAHDHGDEHGHEHDHSHHHADAATPLQRVP